MKKNVKGNAYESFDIWGEGYYRHVSVREGLRLDYTDDVKSIHEAKNILLKTLDHPPSLIHLARKAGINHYKLKIGFKEVFGTTVFGFVRQQRLEKP